MEDSAAQPLTRKQREFDVEPSFAQGASANFLGFPDSILGRVAMKDQLIRRCGIAAPGREKNPRRFAQKRVTFIIERERSERSTSSGRIPCRRNSSSHRRFANARFEQIRDAFVAAHGRNGCLDAFTDIQRDLDEPRA